MAKRRSLLDLLMLSCLGIKFNPRQFGRHAAFSGSYNDLAVVKLLRKLWQSTVHINCHEYRKSTKAWVGCYILKGMHNQLFSYTIWIRYPNTACELLTSDVSQINEKLAGDEELINKLYAFLEGPRPLNPLLASFFSKVMGLLITRKSDMVGRNNVSCNVFNFFLFLIV